MCSETNSNAFHKRAGKVICVRLAVFTVVLASAALLGQSTSASSASPGLELPVIMRQSVAAGKTPVGTKVQANLALATLVNGVVIPQEAILSGEVTESVAKSATEPSRLAIRLDTAQWKNGSASIKVYLTPWYYPAALATNQDLSSGLPDASRHPSVWEGAGVYPGRRNPGSAPFPGTDKDAGASSSGSQRRVLMKDVETTRNSDGSATLTSKRSNLKLDKTLTYVFATSDLLPPK
jgi:hypothetical protein